MATSKLMAILMLFPFLMLIVVVPVTTIAEGCFQFSPEKSVIEMVGDATVVMQCNVVSHDQVDTDSLTFRMQTVTATTLFPTLVSEGKITSRPPFLENDTFAKVQWLVESSQELDGLELELNAFFGNDLEHLSKARDCRFVLRYRNCCSCSDNTDNLHNSSPIMPSSQPEFNYSSVTVVMMLVFAIQDNIDTWTS